MALMNPFNPLNPLNFMTKNNEPVIKYNYSLFLLNIIRKHPPPVQRVVEAVKIPDQLD